MSPLRIVASLGSALLIGGCAPKGDDSGGAPEQEDLATTLPARGPYDVGYVSGSVTYPDRLTGEDRTLRLAVWYPAKDAVGDAPVYNGLYISQGAVAGATLATDGPFPLAVFSHGHQAYAECSSFLMEHLASHGWIVAAPDHTGDTTFDDSERRTDIYYQRPVDISTVIDAMTGLEPAPSAEVQPVLGSVASGQVFVMGHSFGGYTMFPLSGAPYDMDAIRASCADGTGGNICSDLDADADALFAQGFADDRIVAEVAMAPGDSELFGDGLADETMPFLHMTATEDQGPGSEADTIWGALQGGDNRRVILDGGGHNSFTDYSDQIEDVPLEREESFTITRAYVLAFARRWQLGDTTVQPVLDGEVTIDGAAELVE